MAADDNNANSGSTTHPPSFIAWPPPELEAVQGSLWEVTRQIGLGSIILVLPLLWSIMPDRGFSSLGPFGDRWWVLGVLTLVGLSVWGIGLGKLDRLLRACTNAARNGYGWVTVLQVAADSRKDAGFLLQGAKLYADLDADKRNRVMLLRLMTAGSTAAAVIWLPLVFFLSVLLATRGALGQIGVAWITLAPVALLLLAAVACRIAQATITWGPRRKWHARASAQHQVGDDIAVWNSDVKRTVDRNALIGGGVLNLVALRWSRLVAPLVAVVVIVTALTLVVVEATHTILVAISVPVLDRVQVRAAAAEALRPQRLTPDPGVTMQAAGEALQAIEFVAREQEPHPLEVPPVRSYDRPWFADREWGPFELPADGWQDQLFARVAGGLSSEQRAYLTEVAEHPAHREIETLARAAAADVASARWRIPFPDTVSIIALPIAHLSSMRQAMLAHVGKAALEFSQGRRRQAETTIREIISVGFLMTDESPTLVENMVGITATKIGGDALEAFYVASGRAADAEALRFARDLAAHAGELANLSGAARDIQAGLFKVQRIVEDTLSLRGMRWELLASINSYGPCINLNKIVFGAGQTFDMWLDRVRESLVRWPGEEALFDLTQYGYIGPELREGSGGWLQSITSLTLSRTHSTGQCTAVLGALQRQESF